MKERELSIFARLAIMVSLPLAFGTVTLAVAAWLYARAAADEAYDRLLLGAALQISESISVRSGRLAVELPVSAFEMLALSERDRIFYRIIAPDGDTLTGYDDLALPEDAALARRGSFVQPGRFRGESVRTATVARVFSDPAVAGRSYVVVAQTEQSRRALARELTLRAVGLVLVTGILALVGLMLAIGHALTPLKRLENALRARDPNDLTALSINTPREIRPFVSAINYFMERLRQRIGVLQHFIADVAHQIRTPLTALSSQVDLLTHAELDDKGRQHVRRVQERTAELARLTNQLLSHAMVIHRSEAVQLETFDVTEIVRRALRDAVPDSLDRDVVVSLEAPTSAALVAGDRVSLKEAIANVIDNAIRHGATTRLTVRVLPSGNTVTIEVEDDGPGIPTAEWPRVTQRFTHGSRGPGGTGLGFAIAAEVIQAHRGSLTFRCDERGFAVIVCIPRSAGEKL